MFDGYEEGKLGGYADELVEHAPDRDPADMLQYFLVELPFQAIGLPVHFP